MTSNKKWLSVKALKSFGSSLTDAYSWLFKVASISVENVIETSLETGRSCVTILSALFIVFTSDSQAPSIHEMEGGIRFQDMQ